MTKAIIRAASLADVAPLAADLRSADVAELKALSGSTPREALLYGISGGVSRTVCLPDGTPSAIFGVARVGDAGAIWMVATNSFKSLHRQFLRDGQKELALIGAPYPVLFNYTDARNHVHHRWLQWMGFTIFKRHETFGHEGRPFLEFARITEVNHV